MQPTPASDLQNRLDRFETYLKKSDMKITRQRMQVAEHIFCSSNHFTVESLADELKHKYRPGISRATIYRIVSLMVEAGMLTEHNFGQNSRRYEFIPGQKHHDHIICLDCGRIDEFVDSEIEKLQPKIAKKHGFTLEDHSLNLYGRCVELARKNRCPHHDAAVQTPGAQMV
ncbi:MAG: transcriptional repressor [Leptospiraceae bacterium]|nr:transcriptional repressor [Leptospiraceae bacterium]